MDGVPTLVADRLLAAWDAVSEADRRARETEAADAHAKMRQALDVPPPGARPAPAKRSADDAGSRPTRDETVSDDPPVVVERARPADVSSESLPWVPQPTGADKGVGSDALRAVREELGDCQRCKLAGRRANIVFGVGNPDARLMFIGEAPGADEDRQGEPFVGKAGQLLTKMIGAMGLSRDDVYIANVVKCRPPGNRDPEPDEVAMCRPFLDRQIAAIEPEVIVTLGRVAPMTLFDRSVAITRERGRWVEYQGVPVMLTFHPAYLLRTPSAKRDAWADLQDVMRRLDLPLPERR